MERTGSGAIKIQEGAPQAVSGPTEVGTGRPEEERLPLSEIIEVLNEHFGTQFFEDDRLFFQQIKEKAYGDRRVIETALANPLDRFTLGVRKLIESLMVERHGENDQLVERCLGDAAFQAVVYPMLIRDIFDTIHRNAVEHQGYPTPH